MSTATPTNPATDPQAAPYDYATAMRAAPHTFAWWASDGAWIQYRHLIYLGRQINAGIRAGNFRCIVNMPPGGMKSTFLLKWTPLWYLENWRYKRVMAYTHGDALGSVWGRAVRNEVARNPKVTISLAPDRKERNQWETPEGGGMKTGGVGSGSTGFRGDLLLLDDPYPTVASAYSAAYRRELFDWWHHTFCYRMEPGASIVLVNHRMHPKDITNHLLNETGEKWTHICLPQLALPGDPLGRAPGEPLCPERFDLAAVERLRLGGDAGGVAFETQQQQNPDVSKADNCYHRFGTYNLAPDLELTPALPLLWCIDFNRTPSMHLVLGQYDPRADEFRWRYELTASRNLHGTLKEFAEWLKVHPGPWPAVHIHGDASGRTKNTQTGMADYAIIRARLAEIMPGVSIRFRVPAANPPIVDRVSAFNEALRDAGEQTHTRIHPECRELLRDLREQPVDDEGKPDEGDNTLGHSAAAAGYAVHYLRRNGHRPRTAARGRFIFTDEHDA